MERLAVLELYSGIGGMHYALKESGVDAEVVAAVDVNTTANEIYRHNFPATPLWSKTIECITLDEFNKLQFDMILMSPPCQPFTRIGLQGDISDPRTKSFLYILQLLPRLTKRPQFLLLENVKGFETSSARDITHFPSSSPIGCFLGIPNSRLRYFLIARTLPGKFSFPATSEILETFPDVATSESVPERPRPTSVSKQDQERQILYKLETPSELERKRSQNSDGSIRVLQEYLQEETELEDVGQFLLPPKTLLRYALVMDIVQPTCRRSVCFTKGYGHYVEGTGSVLQSCMNVEMEEAFRCLDSLSEEEKLKQLSKLRLRYFTPREIANLMGFPAHFGFPEKTSIKQQYRVLGNSLNVHVVARLIKLMVQ
uniref:tRNA (cytosine(38)-C(5))-methyltransferase n=1 Tax=Scleropages formosus TaxID=113540 RepID=A0A8C9VE18_SCLFO